MLKNHYYSFLLHKFKFQNLIRTGKTFKGLLIFAKITSFCNFYYYIYSPTHKSHKDLDVIYFFILFSISDFFNFLEQEF